MMNIGVLASWHMANLWSRKSLYLPAECHQLLKRHSREIEQSSARTVDKAKSSMVDSYHVRWQANR